MTRDSDAAATSASDEMIVPLFEEEARVEKRQVATGRVRIRTMVESAEEIASVALDEEQVDVTRVPINRVVTEAPAIRTENGVTIIPIMEEVLVVEKQLVLREELHVRRLVTTETVEIPVTLRRQHAVIQRLDGDGNSTEDEEIER